MASKPSKQPLLSSIKEALLPLPSSLSRLPIFPSLVFHPRFVRQGIILSQIAAFGEFHPAEDLPLGVFGRVFGQLGREFDRHDHCAIVIGDDDIPGHDQRAPTRDGHVHAKGENIGLRVKIGRRPCPIPNSLV